MQLDQSDQVDILGEVENECTLHNFIVLANFVLKIIKFSENLAKL